MASSAAEGPSTGLPALQMGAVAALRRELGLPIRFVGLGEGLDDLAPFDAHGYAEGLLASDL